MIDTKMLYDPHLRDQWETIADAVEWSANNGYSYGRLAMEDLARMTGAEVRVGANGYLRLAERPWRR